MDIDAVIAEAVASEPKDEPKVEVATEEVTQEVPEELPSEEEGEKKVKPEDVEFNKKALNAISYRDKKIGKLQAQLAYEREQTAALKARQAPPAPKEEDFEGKPYEDLLTAKAEHAADMRMNQREVEQQEQRVSQMEAAAREEARAAVDNDAELARKVFQDFDESIDSLAETKGGRISISPAVQSAIELSDNPAHTLYAISKEPGALQYLNSLPPIMAAKMVRDFELKAAELPKIKRVSTAPAPIDAARGTASGGKSVEQMSAKELLALTR